MIKGYAPNFKISYFLLRLFPHPVKSVGTESFLKKQKYLP